MKTKTGLKVKTTIKAGSLTTNHSRRGLRIRVGVRSGSLTTNHSRRGLVVKSAVRAGLGHFGSNHNARLLSLG